MRREISTTVKLRPTRIAFLVRPSDRSSIRKVMRANSCLWGGTFNPIIPIFRNTPRDWREKRGFRRLTGKQVAKGYVKFFEPDAYVETVEGLLEEAGLGILRGDSFEPNVVTIDEFLEAEFRGVNEPKFGLSVYDLYEHVYKTERQFALRDPSPAYYPADDKEGFAESCLGAFPEGDNVNHIKNAFFEVYQPELVDSTADTWIRLFSRRRITPLSTTRSFFEVRRTWRDDPIIYVFNPTKTTDLIDLWNIRLQPSPVVPVPIRWLSEVADSLKEFIAANHRPLRDNPHGVMHTTTLEFARSINDEQAKDELIPHFAGVPQGAMISKHWRTQIWSIDYNQQMVMQPERARLEAAESSQSLTVKDEGFLHTDFQSLNPEFAQRYSGSRKRWANILTFSAGYTFESQHAALILPYNTFDPKWPTDHLGQFGIGREGWVFTEDHFGGSSLLSLMEPDVAIQKWLERNGTASNLSDAGRIAKQMLESLGGFWGLFLVDDTYALKFLNKLANSTRVRISPENGEVIEDTFLGGAAGIVEWQAMIVKRQAGGAHSQVGLKEYLDRSVARIGLESSCPTCGANNWSGLDQVDYVIRCGRCLREYPFPQAEIRHNNQNWKYKVIGPFAVPDFAQGAYSALLTIRFFAKFRNKSEPTTFSTALELSDHDESMCEVDFAIWTSDQRGWDVYGEPRLIVGEAKSFAKDGVKDRDIDQLKKVAQLLPEAFFVISILKDSFSKEERNRLERFVNWTRSSGRYGPKHWVILLTSIELFNDHLERNWERAGEPHSNFADFQHTRSLEALSDATLAIYLGLKPYHQWYEDNSKK